MKTCNKFFAELFGTFVLVFGGCGTALFGQVGFLGVAIAFGLTVVAMAYGIGHISGAHLNPARSLGVALFSDCASWSACGQVWLFIVAPLVGACLAGLAYKCIMGNCCCKKCEK